MADGSEDLPYQSLYRRFRPSTFAEVRGQDHVVLALRNAVRDGRVAHAYLFSGPRGTGKTSTARILAKALNCTDLHDGEPCGVCGPCVEIARGTSLDVHELDAASNNGVDAMRDLVSRAALGSPGRQKVYIVDEVHMLSNAASNALLKTLEEPPPHVVFVLATTDQQKVLPTIRSRTQHYEFHLLGPDTLTELLSQVRRDAHLEVGDDALDLAVRRGRGSARDALSVLDQVVASDAVDDDLPELDEVVEGLAERDVGRALVAVARLTGVGFSPQQLAVDLVDHLRQGFLAIVAPELVTVSGAERDALAAQASRVGLAALVQAMELLGLAQVAMRDAPDPRVTLEVALVRLAHPEADDSPAALLARIERLESDRAVTGEVRSTPQPSPARPAESAEAGPVGPRKTLGAVRRQASSPAEPPQQPVPTQASTAEPSTADPPTAEPPVGEPPQAEAPAVPLDRRSADVAAAFPTRDQLVQAWGDQVIGRLRPKAKALYQAGRFVGVEGERARFGLPNETHCSRCAEMKDEVEAALGECFGRPVGLELVVDAAAGEPDGAVGRPSGPDPGALVDTPARSAGRTAARTPAVVAAPAPEPDPDEHDLSAFDDAGTEVAEFDNSAEARVLQAFPGAEEVE